MNKSCISHEIILLIKIDGWIKLLKLRMGLRNYEKQPWYECKFNDFM